MSNTIISANMSLPIPVPGVDPGPDYAYNENACFLRIDAHNHTPGNGVQITPGGLNINSDLTLQNNNLYLVRSVRMNPQSAALALISDVGCIYEVGIDLYYNDGNGTPIRITQSGAVAGTPGSISNLVSPASASYNAVSSTFIFQSAALTPANIDGASYILRNLSASSFGVTLSPPNALGSDYTVTLPSLPGSTLPLSISSSGSMSAAQISTAQIANNAITTALIADSNVTKPKLSALGQQISSSCGNFSMSGGSLTAVTNLSVTITTTGRPVFIGLIDDGSLNASGSFIGLSQGTANSSSTFAFFRDSTQITNYTVGLGGVLSGNGNNFIPSSALSVIDLPSLGTYTYVLKVSSSASVNAVVLYSKLIAYEL